MTTMTNLPDIARRITEARRTKGLTQSALAHQAGCKQSAISMFERGHENALARSKVDMILKLLGIEIATPAASTAAVPVTTPPPALRYCPVFDCPSNIPFTVQSKLLLFPRLRVPPENSRHCHFCGELLENACPECGAAVNHGACCSQCGAPYISVPPDNAGTLSADDWTEAQHRRLRTLGILA
jgi:transcriptional regulator with XRE-family HTH domain